MPAPLRDWYASAVTVQIGAELLAAEPDEPSRADELARKLGRPERSIRELLERLNSGRLVTRAQLQTGEPGRPPWGHWLTDEQRPAAQRAVDTPEVLREARRREQDSAPPTSEGEEASDGTERSDPSSVVAQAPRRPDISRLSGQELVIVDVHGPGYAQLLEALSGTRTADAATWVFRVGSEVGFLFDSSDAAAAGNLLAVLSGARLSVRSESVRQVMPAAEFISHAQQVTPEIRRARSTRDAHDAPQ